MIFKLYSVTAWSVADGITGATVGVLTALVIADITTGSGRFNLTQGAVGTLSGIGATPATRELANIVILDSAHLLEAEARDAALLIAGQNSSGRDSARRRPVKRFPAL